jgi:hypothetical protein
MKNASGYPIKLYFYFRSYDVKGDRMFHEMQAAETSSMIVSMPVLARYEIGGLTRTYHYSISVTWV